MKFRSILVVTYGRSGSTLLQGLLNSIDGVYVAGENGNFLYGAFLAHDALQKAVKKFSGAHADNPTGAWYGINSTDPDCFVRGLWPLVKGTLFSDASRRTRCFGFKEIRYFELVPRSRLHAYLDFLAELFPDPAFVINLRNHDDVLRSAWWPRRANRTALRKRLAAFEQSLLEWQKAHRDRSFVIRYEELVARPARVKRLFEFLGARFDERRYKRVLATPHSYDQKPAVLRRVKKLAAKL